MKILIVYTAVSLFDNPFVRLLAENLRARGHEVDCSVPNFRHNPAVYDIVHLQWPEEVFGWKNPEPDEVDALERQLGMLREKGIPIVYTRHNSRPHHPNPLIDRAYRICERAADAVVHMGEYSLREFMAAYPDSKQRQVVIPHHIYEGYYNWDITREAGRRTLGIPDDAFVVLSFGAFRHAEERRLVWGAFRRLEHPRKLLVAPRFCPCTLHGTKLRGLKRLANYAVYLGTHAAEGLFRCRITNPQPMIHDRELAYFLAAADVVFIQRTGILNSGNVPLGLSFGRVVTGPACGNIGGLLRETGNPSFDPADPASVDRALAEAARLSDAGKGDENRVYAREHFGTARITSLYEDLYQSLDAFRSR